MKKPERETRTLEGKQRIAVALQYEEPDAPKVTASGVSDVAEQIIALAEEHGVPVSQDPELVVQLSQLKLDEEIPPHLYRAVAEVIAFAYVLRGKFPKDWQP